VGKHRLYSISCWTIIYSILTTTILTDASGYLLEFWLVFLPWLMILSYFSYTSFPVVLIYLLIYLFLGGTVVCTQGLDLLTWALYMTWVTPPACFALACFSDLVPLFSQAGLNPWSSLLCLPHSWDYRHGLPYSVGWSFEDEWIQWEDIWARLIKRKAACFLSYLRDRYNANTSNIRKNRLW
jgi:hypothetical protein